MITWRVLVFCHTKMPWALLLWARLLTNVHTPSAEAGQKNPELSLPPPCIPTATELMTVGLAPAPSSNAAERWICDSRGPHLGGHGAVVDDVVALVQPRVCRRGRVPPVGGADHVVGDGVVERDAVGAVGDEGAVARVTDHDPFDDRPARARAVVEVERVAAGDVGVRLEPGDVRPHVSDRGVLDGLRCGRCDQDVGTAGDGALDDHVAGQVEQLGAVAVAVHPRHLAGTVHQREALPTVGTVRRRPDLVTGPSRLPAARPGHHRAPLDVEVAGPLDPEPDVVGELGRGRGDTPATLEVGLVDVGEDQRVGDGRRVGPHHQRSLHHHVAGHPDGGVGGGVELPRLAGRNGEPVRQVGVARADDPVRLGLGRAGAPGDQHRRNEGDSHDEGTACEEADRRPPEVAPWLEEGGHRRFLSADCCPTPLRRSLASPACPTGHQMSA